MDLFTTTWSTAGFNLTQEEVDDMWRLGVNPETTNAHLIVAAYRSGHDAGYQACESELVDD